VSLTVVIHHPAQLAVQPGILTRHVVGGVGGAGIDHARLPGLDGRRHAEALKRIGGGEEQRLAAGGGERVPHGGEDEDEEEEDEAEEGGGDDVQHAPLARAAQSLRGWEVDVTHRKPYWMGSKRHWGVAFWGWARGRTQLQMNEVCLMRVKMGLLGDEECEIQCECFFLLHVLRLSLKDHSQFHCK